MNLNDKYDLNATLALNYTAQDALSGVLSGKILVLKPGDTVATEIANGGSIKLDKAGTYKVTVIVTDAAGNSTTVEKTVTVSAPVTPPTPTTPDCPYHDHCCGHFRLEVQIFFLYFTIDVCWDKNYNFHATLEFGWNSNYNKSSCSQKLPKQISKKAILKLFF